MRCSALAGGLVANGDKDGHTPGDNSYAKRRTYSDEVAGIAVSEIFILIFNAYLVSILKYAVFYSTVLL